MTPRRQLPNHQPSRNNNRVPAVHKQTHPITIPSSQKKTPLTSKKVKKTPGKKRLYVLDTNIFMHDPLCVFHFEEHDIFLARMVVQELDKHKKGQDEINRNVRETTRTLLEKILHNVRVLPPGGVSLRQASGNKATGHLILQTIEPLNTPPQATKPDDIILYTVLSLMEKYRDTHEVILVSKDANMRITALTMGILSEDYHNDMVIEDSEFLPAGSYELPPKVWSDGFINEKVGAGASMYSVTGPLVKRYHPNEFIYSTKGDFSARVVEKSDRALTVRRVDDYSQGHKSVAGIHARNREQNFALNLLMDEDVDLVVLVGIAGSGKTLLALAAGLDQVIDKKRYSEIVVTRATVPIGDEIGFLPGNEEDKMGPWMGALDDNIDVLSSVFHRQHQKNRLAGGHKVSLSDMQESHVNDLSEKRKELMEHIKIKSIGFMRGRTFLRKYLIVDEVQNLTQKQAKTLITRAGPGTKIVCMGNLAQIDTPYLTEGSSGLSYIVKCFHEWSYGGHIILPKGERSRLASHANDVM